MRWHIGLLAAVAFLLSACVDLKPDEAQALLIDAGLNPWAVNTSRESGDTWRLVVYDNRRAIGGGFCATDMRDVSIENKHDRPLIRSIGEKSIAVSALPCADASTMLFHDWSGVIDEARFGVALRAVLDLAATGSAEAGVHVEWNGVRQPDLAHEAVPAEFDGASTSGAEADLRFNVNASDGLYLRAKVIFEGKTITRIELHHEGSTE